MAGRERAPTPRPADARRRRPCSHVPPTRATPSVIRQCLLTGRREQLTDRTGKSRASYSRALTSTRRRPYLASFSRTEYFDA